MADGGAGEAAALSRKLRSAAAGKLGYLSSGRVLFAATNAKLHEPVAALRIPRTFCSTGWRSFQFRPPARGPEHKLARFFPRQFAASWVAGASLTGIRVARIRGRETSVTLSARAERGVHSDGR